MSTGTLHVLDHTGDTRTIWNSDNQAEVDAAKSQFRKLRKRGYLAYRVNAAGERGEQVHEFDPTAGRLIMAAPLVGG